MNTRATVLIVDDQTPNRETLRELLDTGDYRLVEAADGATALRMAAEIRPDLVLLDVMMPGMDGYEVCRRLRADARVAEIPVIMITALDDQASRLTGIEAGADDFITKPFNRVELRARVRTIARLNRYHRLLETQEQLHESEVRFRKLAEHSDEVFWFFALHPERIAYISPAVEKMRGVPAARFYEDARLWIQTIHPDDRARVQAAHEALFSGRADRLDEEYRVIQPDGTVHWVLDSGTPIRDEAGAVVSAGGVARDISERKDAEEHMLRAQRLENIGMLSAGIAHDFNNALAPIIIAGPLLRMNVSSPVALRLIDTVQTCSERGAGLVRQLLAFASGASGDRVRLQPRHLLREVGELAEITFPKSIKIKTVWSADLWDIQANPTQIHQVLLNLCVNARDAMPQGGELTLTATNCTLDVTAAAGIPDGRPGDFLAVKVSDTGTGIPSEVLTRIWEPFYTTKGEGKGTGLGLSTVRGIATQHAGFVTVQTRLGHGTAFTVYLPAATEAPAVQPFESPLIPA